MEVIFRTKVLQTCYEDYGKAIRRWNQSVGKKYIQRVNTLQALPTFEDLSRMRSLRFHALKGAREGQFALDLNNRWRLIVARGETDDIVIVLEVTNHYDD